MRRENESDGRVVEGACSYSSLKYLQVASTSYDIYYPQDEFTLANHLIYIGMHEMIHREVATRVMRAVMRGEEEVKRGRVIEN